MGNICTKQSLPPPLLPATIDIPSHLSQSCLDIRSFQVLRVLSKRPLGKVLLVTKTDTKAVFVIKTIKKSKILDRKTKKHALSERNVLAQAKSPFLVNLHFAFQNSLKLYLVLEFMQGGDLFYHFQKHKRFSVSVARFYCAEVLLALRDLHRHNIIYRDLKLENILLTRSGHSKLADFNLAKLLNNEKLRTRTICGTPEYLSPEVVKGCDQTFKVDFWSLGVLVYEMLEGVTPFYAKSRDKLFRNIMKCNLSFSEFVPSSARDLIGNLVRLCPWDRPKSVEEIQSMEFFQEIDWDDLQERKIPPPIFPKIENEIDCRYFKRLETEVSPENSNPSQGNNFKGFSYTESPEKI